MIRIRRATVEDADFIVETYRPFVEEHYASFERTAPDAEETAKRITDAGDLYPWLVAEDDAPLAYAYASPHRTRAAYRSSVDTTIYAAPKARGKGVGKALYGALFDILTTQNYVMAYAGIALPNEASIALHRSVGFELIGTYPSVGFKGGTWRDTQWWGRPLAQPSIPPKAILSVTSVLDQT
ncbi:MAG: N-acetyltransferase family protein [Pseudomonadota bacterium]